MENQHPSGQQRSGTPRRLLLFVASIAAAGHFPGIARAESSADNSALIEDLLKAATESVGRAKESAGEAKQLGALAAKLVANAQGAEPKLTAAAKAATVSDRVKECNEAFDRAAAAKAAAIRAGGDLAKVLESAAAAKAAAQDAEAALKAGFEVIQPPNPAPAIDKGDTAWMLTSSALVMLMVPGLALFYAGMVRTKNVLGTMMHSMAALAIIGVEWVVIGYALSFGATQYPTADKVDYTKEAGAGKPGIAVTRVEEGVPATTVYGEVRTEQQKDGSRTVVRTAGLIGWQRSFVMMRGVRASVPSNDRPLPNDLGQVNEKFAGETPGKYAESVPAWVHMMFQGMFAIITPALISGAIAERVRFMPYCAFILLWGLIVYNPLAHWVWGYGLLGQDGARALDFAGGTVVHLSAGVSALACILILGKRKDYPRAAVKPNNLGLTILGAGLLWFGWFGFNAGSALGSGDWAGHAFATTQLAAAAAGLSWMICEQVHRGKPTALGLATGIVAGLVGITPAAGFVGLVGALVIGLGVSVVCYVCVNLKQLLGYDDSLDVVGVHGVGGLFGALMTGLLFVDYGNFPSWAKVGEDLPSIGLQFMRQLKAVGLAGVYCFVVTAVIVCVLQKTIGFRADEEEEEAGLDLSQHGETGYHLN